MFITQNEKSFFQMNEKKIIEGQLILIEFFGFKPHDECKHTNFSRFNYSKCNFA